MTNRAAKLTLAALVCCLAPTVSRAAGRLYQVREIKPRVFVWIPDDVIEAEGDPQYTRAGTAGFIIADQGVVVINTTNSPFHARELLYEIRRRTEEPVWYVINTGSSGDETLGNEVFGDLRSVILSTAQIQAAIRERGEALAARERGDRELQRRMRGIHITPPNRTFEGQMDLPVAPLSLQLIAFDPGVKGVAVYLPQLRIAFLGDLFQNEYFPRLESRDIHSWIEALRKAEAWDADVYVPGHGEPAGRNQLQQFRQFLEWLTSEVQTRIREGKPLERVELEMLPFKGYSWHAPEQAPLLLADVYRQLAGKGRPPSAASGASSPPKP
jgi:cyclase